jgi:hypothetical protein
LIKKYLPLNPSLYQFTPNELHTFRLSQRQSVELLEETANLKLIGNDLQRLLNNKEREIVGLRARNLSLSNALATLPPTNSTQFNSIKRDFISATIELVRRYPSESFTILVMLVYFITLMSELLN